MLRRFAKVAVVAVLFLGTSCSSFTWTGRSGGVDAEAAARGVKDVATLRRDYETQRYWARQRRYMAGRAAAFHEGIDRMAETFDRSFLNYSRTDPTLNR